jgi:hypothetical protein
MGREEAGDVEGGVVVREACEAPVEVKALVGNSPSVISGALAGVKVFRSDCAQATWTGHCKPENDQADTVECEEDTSVVASITSLQNDALDVPQPRVARSRPLNGNHTVSVNFYRL